MKSFTKLLPLAMALLGCGEPDSPIDRPESVELEGLERLLDLGPGLVEDASVRREALVSSIVNPTNGYSALRLNEYGLGDTGWDALPERNFAVRATTVDDVGRFVDDPYALSAGTYVPVFDRDAFEWSHEALLELGRRSFHEYPLSLDAGLHAAFESDQTVEEAGLVRDDDRFVGMMRVRLESAEVFAATCASCHASNDGAALIDGRTNARIDRDRIARMVHGLPGSTWGPGSVDVTSDGVVNPAAITDLRGVRYQGHLHWAATLYNSPEALAVRVETLMITSANQKMRPPREVAVAIAYYLWSLGEEAPAPDESLPGAEIFAANCSACHSSDGSTSPPVDLATIGTDPLVGESTMRGTGRYRIPTLYRVGSRTQFLHEGKVESLEELLDPARLAEVRGHEHGLALDDVDRAHLIEYLQTF